MEYANALPSAVLAAKTNPEQKSKRVNKAHGVRVMECKVFTVAAHSEVLQGQLDQFLHGGHVPGTLLKHPMEGPLGLQAIQPE